MALCLGGASERAWAVLGPRLGAGDDASVGLALAGTLFDRFGIHTYYLVTVAVSVPLIIAVMLSPRSNEVDAGR